MNWLALTRSETYNVSDVQQRRKVNKMAEKEKPKRIRLRTIPEMREASEWLFNEIKDGHIDNKTGDALNTTFKQSVYLNATLPATFAKIIIQAAIKKVSLPDGLLPEIVFPWAEKNEEKDKGAGANGETSK